MNTLVMQYALPILIGVLSSLVASIMFLLFISGIRPNIEISDLIAKLPVSRSDEPPFYVIKVINRSRRAVIDVRADLYLLTPKQVPDGFVLETKEIKLKRNNLFEIPGYNKDDIEARYAFRFSTQEDLDAIWKNDSQTYLRFRVYAKDEFSGFGKVFSQDYRTKRLAIKHGDLHFGDSFEIA